MSSPPPLSFSSLDPSAMADAAAERIGMLFEQQSEADYIGEPVSVLEHSWQVYACAKAAGAPERVQVASLLHDVGHMLGIEAGYDMGMDGCGFPNHETIGSDFLLSLGFHPYTCWLVANHVNAKRFLVWKNPNYELTQASRTTLGFQGGPMSDAEAKAFMSVPGYEATITMRSFDEAAKVPGLPKPSIVDIKEIVRAHVKETQTSVRLESSPFTFVDPSHKMRYLSPSFRLSDEQLRFYEENGYLVIKGHSMLTKSKDLSKLADELCTNPGKDMLVHHEEVKVHGTDETRVQICRVENFVDSVRDWNVISNILQDICGELFGEPAVLFKDKLNYKLPGGGGFKAHQDATAYKPDEFASTHISVMVAIDPAQSDVVGPLQFAKGRHKEGIFDNSKGVIASTVESDMNFKPLYVDAGDIVFFSSYIPHRSEGNNSKKGRRLAYLTYNKLSEGDFNRDYYQAKLESFREGTGGTISINDDFGGKIVAQ